MRIDLSNKAAVVTGSTAGIGFAIAKGLAQCGSTVVVTGRTKAAVDKAIAALTSTVPGAVIRGVSADLGTAEGCATLVKAEPSADILVNNVGIYGPQDFFEIPDGEWTRFFEVNVMSGVRLSRAYLPGMMVQRNWGRVVFLSSESALNIPADMIHYGFTKTANLSISRGLVKRVATCLDVRSPPAPRRAPSDGRGICTASPTDRGRRVGGVRPSPREGEEAMGGPWRDPRFDPTTWRTPAAREARSEAAESGDYEHLTRIVIVYIASMLTSIAILLLKNGW